MKQANLPLTRTKDTNLVIQWPNHHWPQPKQQEHSIGSSHDQKMKNE